MARFVQKTLILHHPDTQELVTLVPGTPVPEWAEPLITRDDVVADYEMEEFEEAGVDYEGLTVPELMELIRDREIEPESGRKADLITALRADDDAADE